MKATPTTNSTDFKQLNGLKLLAGLAVVLTLAASSITTHAAIIAHWTFDESSGPVAHDSAGSFNGNLSPTGATFVSGGISGNALSLDRAANGFVNMGNVLGLTTGDFSIVSWVKTSPGDTTEGSLVVGKHAAGFVNGYFLGLNNSGNYGQAGKVYFYDSAFPGQEVTSTTSVNDGTWHQIVSVYHAGGNALIYVDGTPVEVSKLSQPIVANTVAFLIGGANFNGVPTSLLTGLIDDVQVYNHALSDGDIDFLFQHPGQVVLDCSQQLAAANATIASLQAQLATCNNALAAANQNIQNLQNEILALVLPLQLLTQEFRTTFHDAQFQIPGVTAVEQMQNLVDAILDLRPGQQQALFYNLSGQKNRR